MNSGWAVPVPILPDELLSSWLARAAITQGCDPLVLTGAVWPRWRCWATDIDRGLSDDRLLLLAAHSGVEPSKFSAATIRPTALAITRLPPLRLDKLAIWPWVLAQGSRNRRRHGGLSYCPGCLQDFKIPYFRQQWRLAWHTQCSVHATLLLDQCSKCHAPLEFHRLCAEDGHLAICATCKSDLRLSSLCAQELPPYGSKALAFQMAADAALRSGDGFFGAEKIAAAGWFELSHYFITLLRKVALNPHGVLAMFVKNLGVDTENLLPPATGLPFELLPVLERARFVAATWEMICAGSNHWMVAASAASLTQASFRVPRMNVPAPLTLLIESLPSGVSPRVNGQKDGRKPRTPQTVMHMFARLQRKLSVEDR